MRADSALRSAAGRPAGCASDDSRARDMSDEPSTATTTTTTTAARRGGQQQTAARRPARRARVAATAPVDGSSSVLQSPASESPSDEHSASKASRRSSSRRSTRAASDGGDDAFSPSSTSSAASTAVASSSSSSSSSSLSSPSTSAPANISHAYANDRFGSRVQFLVASLGFAVGLGNLWRFPYVAARYGGGAFLIPYFLSYAAFGVPLVVLEMSLGLHFQATGTQIFGGFHRRLRGIGFAAVLMLVLICAYYATVLAWTLLYLVHSFSPTGLPWAQNANAFFAFNVLERPNMMDGGIGALNGWVVFSLLLVWIIVFAVNARGPRSLGRVSIVTVTLPYFLLLALAIRGLTLEGAGDGLRALFVPRWEELADPSVWGQAAAQVIFSMSPAVATLISFGSFRERGAQTRIVRDAVLVCIGNALTSLFAGVVVFSVLGHLAFESGLDVHDPRVATDGPGLAFVVYAEVLAAMPIGALFSVLFFLALMLLGLTSVFAWVQTLVSEVMSWQSVARVRLPRPLLTLAVCVFMFCAGLLFSTDIGAYLLDLFDHFVPQFGLLLVGGLEMLAVTRVYGFERFARDVRESSGEVLSAYFHWTWAIIGPLCIVVLLVVQIFGEIVDPPQYADNFSVLHRYPQWALIVGWTLTLLPVVAVLLGVIFPAASVERAGDSARATTAGHVSAGGDGDVQMRPVGGGSRARATKKGQFAKLDDDDEVDDDVSSGEEEERD